jgi:hypothetical protein
MTLIRHAGIYSRHPRLFCGRQTRGWSACADHDGVNNADAASLSFVMPGFIPGIHDFFVAGKP